VDIHGQEGDPISKARQEWETELTPTQIKECQKTRALWLEACSYLQYRFAVIGDIRTINDVYVDPNWSSDQDLIKSWLPTYFGDPKLYASFSSVEKYNTYFIKEFKAKNSLGLLPTLMTPMNRVYTYTGTFGPNACAEILPDKSELFKLIACCENESNLGIDFSRPVKVPKDFKGPRVIAPEPVHRSYYQHAYSNLFRGIVERCLRVDFTRQELNRIRCKLAYATVDLSSASDSVKTSHVEIFLPDHSGYLNTLRTGKVGYYLPVKKGKPGGTMSQPIHTFATMGSPNTFDVETCIFKMIDVAAIYEEGIKQHVPDHELVADMLDVAVYGDDSVIPLRYANAVVEKLSQCGFKPNLSKTYGCDLMDGYRETCGVETFCDVDITPVRVARGQLCDWIKTSEPIVVADFCNELAKRRLFKTAAKFISVYNSGSRCGKFAQKIYKDLKNLYGKKRKSRTRPSKPFNEARKSLVVIGTTWDDSLLQLRDVAMQTEELKDSLAKCHNSRIKTAFWLDFQQYVDSLTEQEYNLLTVFSPLSANYRESSLKLVGFYKIDKRILRNRSKNLRSSGNTPFKDNNDSGCSVDTLSSLGKDDSRTTWLGDEFVGRVDNLGHITFTEDEWDYFARDYILRKQTYEHDKQWAPFVGQRLIRDKVIKSKFICFSRCDDLIGDWPAVLFPKKEVISVTSCIRYTKPNTFYRFVDAK
jgi:hypothetical protein